MCKELAFVEIDIYVSSFEFLIFVGERCIAVEGNFSLLQ